MTVAVRGVNDQFLYGFSVVVSPCRIVHGHGSAVGVEFQNIVIVVIGRSAAAAGIAAAIPAVRNGDISRVVAGYGRGFHLARAVVAGVIFAAGVVNDSVACGFISDAIADVLNLRGQRIYGVRIGVFQGQRQFKIHGKVRPVRQRLYDNAAILIIFAFLADNVAKVVEVQRNIRFKRPITIALHDFRICVRIYARLDIIYLVAQRDPQRIRIIIIVVVGVLEIGDNVHQTNLFRDEFKPLQSGNHFPAFFVLRFVRPGLVEEQRRGGRIARRERRR